QAEAQAAAEARAAQTVAAAEAAARQLVADATHEVRRLHGVRDDAHAQLEVLATRLQDALAQARAATPDEPELPRSDGSTPA
ncbi:MAG TPA: hypothetical protein VHC23_12460, partial [Jatrophihabitans sp.]|nr:hypothetical protein [Jatrophihabitans sp.]